MSDAIYAPSFLAQRAGPLALLDALSTGLSSARREDDGRPAPLLLARNLRRRTGSHNPHRMPVRLRVHPSARTAPIAEFSRSRDHRRKPSLLRYQHAWEAQRALEALNALSESGAPPSSLPASAASRPAPAVLRRGPLHTWHAKRFLVEERWGHAVPLSRRDIGLKAVRTVLLRAGGGLLHDASYLVPFVLSGAEAALQEALAELLPPCPFGEEGSAAVAVAGGGRGCASAAPEDATLQQPPLLGSIAYDSKPPLPVPPLSDPTRQLSRAQRARRRRMAARAVHASAPAQAGCADPSAGSAQTSVVPQSTHSAGRPLSPAPLSSAATPPVLRLTPRLPRRPVHPLHQLCVGGVCEGAAMLHAPGAFPAAAIGPVRVLWTRPPRRPEPGVADAAVRPAATATVLVWVHAASLREASAALRSAAAAQSATLECLGGQLSRLQLRGPAAGAALACALPTLRIDGDRSSSVPGAAVIASAADPRFAFNSAAAPDADAPVTATSAADAQLCDREFLRDLAARWPSDAQAIAWRARCSGESPDSDALEPEPLAPSGVGGTVSSVGIATSEAPAVVPALTELRAAAPSETDLSDPFMSGGDFVSLGPAPTSAEDLGRLKGASRMATALRRPLKLAPGAVTAAPTAGAKRPRPGPSPAPASGIPRAAARAALQGAQTMVAAAAARRTPLGHACHGAASDTGATHTLCYCASPPPRGAMNDPPPPSRNALGRGAVPPPLPMIIIPDASFQPLAREQRQRASGAHSVLAAYAVDVIVPTACLPTLFTALVRAVRSRAGDEAAEALPRLERPLQVVGVDEMREACALQGVPCFPFDHPDTRAGEREAARSAAAAFESFMARPRSKRTNYAVLRSSAPFQPEWRLVWPETASSGAVEAGASLSLSVVRGAGFVRSFLLPESIEAAAGQAVDASAVSASTSGHPLVSLCAALPRNLDVPTLTPAPTLLRVRVQLIGRGRVLEGAVLCALTDTDWEAWLAWDAQATAVLATLLATRQSLRKALAAAPPQGSVPGASGTSASGDGGASPAGRAAPPQRADAAALAAMGFGGVKAHKKARLLAKAAAAGVAASAGVAEADAAAPTVVELPASAPSDVPRIAASRPWGGQQGQGLIGVDASVVLASAGGSLRGQTHAPGPWPGPAPEPPAPPHEWPDKATAGPGSASPGGVASAPPDTPAVESVEGRSGGGSLAPSHRTQEDWAMTAEAYLRGVLLPSVAAAPPSRQLLGWATSGTAPGGGGVGTGFLRAEAAGAALAAARRRVSVAEEGRGGGAAAAAAVTGHAPVPRQALREAILRRSRVPLLVRNPTEAFYRPALGSLLGLPG